MSLFERVVLTEGVGGVRWPSEIVKANALVRLGEHLGRVYRMAQKEDQRRSDAPPSKKADAVAKDAIKQIREQRAALDRHEQLLTKWLASPTRQQ